VSTIGCILYVYCVLRRIMYALRVSYGALWLCISSYMMTSRRRHVFSLPPQKTCKTKHEKDILLPPSLLHVNHDAGCNGETIQDTGQYIISNLQLSIPWKTSKQLIGRIYWIYPVRH
jgi:hypothetical protein